MNWQMVEKESGERHIVPTDDTMGHWASTGCWCKPTKDEGVWVHHAIDGDEE